MSKYPLIALWETIEELHRKNPRIAGWHRSKNTFYVSLLAEDREFVAKRYSYFSSKNRKNPANTWNSLYNLIHWYAFIESDSINGNVNYTIPHFNRFDQKEINLCMRRKIRGLK
jgi:hypothetical protein